MPVRQQGKWQWKSFYLTTLNSLHLIIMSDFKFRTLSITEAEETALVNIIMYFNDMGLPDTIEHKDYETLSDKICEPAFWEYN